MQKHTCIIFKIYPTMCLEYVQCIEWQLNLCLERFKFEKHTEESYSKINTGSPGGKSPKINFPLCDFPTSPLSLSATFYKIRGHLKPMPAHQLQRGSCEVLSMDSADTANTSRPAPVQCSVTLGTRKLEARF